MIITDQQPSSPSSKRSFPSNQVTQPPSPTPTVPAPEYDAPPPAYLPPLPSSPNPPHSPHKIHHADSGTRRFWRAIRWGIVIYVVVSATVVTPFLVIKLRTSKTVQQPDPVQTSGVPGSDKPKWPPPPGPDPHWPDPHWPDRDWEGDGRWDFPHPHGPPPFGGPGGDRPPHWEGPPPHGPPHDGGPHGWKPECGSEGDGRPGCHRPPNVPWMDGKIVRCNEWRRPTVGEQRPVDDPMPFNSFLTYELPLNMDVFVRAAGRTTAGTFAIVVDDKVKTMEARVEMLFNEHRSYEHTNVCLMDRQQSTVPAMGLGIYMPFGQSHNESISFNIALHVPPMVYNHTIDTHLPIFEQNINLDPRVYLNRIRLSGAASPVLLRGVDAGTVDVKTVYARIKADGVRAGKKLRLATNASPIDATVAVTSNSSTSEPVIIDLQTINAHIAGTILLDHDGVVKPALDDEADEPNADFWLDAQTGKLPADQVIVCVLTQYNSPIFLRVMHTERSDPSVLRANLTTSLGDIELSLDPMFEGSFELETERAAAEVEEDARHTIDPTGMGRRRVVVTKREREGVVRGSVSWRNLSFRQKDGEGIWSGDKVGAQGGNGARIRAVTSRAQNTLLLPSAPDMLEDTAERAALFRALDVVDDVEERMRKAGHECGTNC
ncbi:hypothetical protein FRC06_005829 [Ceratobasidium sp. 370]|nr:hypothetical protein FRC06_005829 [Ceratobasidium sp. 370]